MSNDYFEFKQFKVYQHQCAMKVGTDGTLLGAWANGGQHVLDVGTGTGLIALMLAQRFEDARITAIDIDEGAATQAAENISQSPFAQRITVKKCALQDMYEGGYDAIVSNPPYFINALDCPDEQRSVARHTTKLTYAQLADGAYRLLNDHGEFSVIIPFDCKTQMESEALLRGFFPHRICGVKTTLRKPVRRYLLSFTKYPDEITNEELVIGSDAYKKMLQHFYLAY